MYVKIIFMRIYLLFKKYKIFNVFCKSKIVTSFGLNGV